jgi:Cu-Zn family superoxide dismutase
MRLSFLAPAAVATVLAASGCSLFGRGGGGDTPSPSSSARAQLSDAEGRAMGEASFLTTPHGVLVTVSLNGVPSGTHAIHIHAVGKCEPPFTSAGGHFNPDEKQHGYRNSAGYHAGDLPNINVGPDGSVREDVFIRGLSVSGDKALLDGDGAAIVVHAFADDYTSDPAGNAGARIACGVIR